MIRLSASGLYLGFGINDHLERPLGKVHGGGGTLADIGPEVFGLLPHVLHEGVGVHSVRKTGEVLDEGGGGKLAARLDSLIQDGGEVGAGGIYGSGESGRTSAQNQTFD